MDWPRERFQLQAPPPFRSQGQPPEPQAQPESRPTSARKRPEPQALRRLALRAVTASVARAQQVECRPPEVQLPVRVRQAQESASAQVRPVVSISPGC